MTERAAAEEHSPDPGDRPREAGPAGDPDATAHALRAALQSERAARIEAQRINARRDEFMGLVSHELRTPLNAMVGWLHVLESTRQSDAQVAMRALAGLNRAVRQQSTLVDTLLETARALRGDLVLAPEPFDLVAVVASSVRSRLESGAAFRVELRQAAADCLIEADARRVGDVIDEILAHAARFADLGALHVEVGRDADASRGVVAMRFDDPGADVAWEPFAAADPESVEASPARRRRGLSIGLVLCERLIEMTGGALSLRPGSPSGIRLSWPLAATR